MKLNALKVALAKRILEQDNEATLRIVEDVLGGDIQLSAAQKAELDRDWEAYKAGEGRNKTWNEEKAAARKHTKA